MQMLKLGIAAFAAATMMSGAHAQADYPVKPIR